MPRAAPPLTAARLAAHGGGAATRWRWSTSSCAGRGSRSTTSTAARAGGRAGDAAEVLEAHEVVEAVVRVVAPVARGLEAELGVGRCRPGCSSTATGCGSARRSATSSPTRSSTGRARCSSRVRVGADALRIEVDDDGPGLPAPVAVLAARPRAGRGRRGRGLAIASEIAARHGGRVSAAPAPRGARLVLELPLLADARGVAYEDALLEAPWPACDEWPPVPPGRERGCIPAETGARRPALANRPPWWRRPS